MEAYVVATACTKFEKKPNQTFKGLTEEVYLDLLRAAELENGDLIGQAWFGNCGMGTFGQRNIRGQVCFTPLVNKKLFPEIIFLATSEITCEDSQVIIFFEPDLAIIIANKPDPVPISRTKSSFEIAS